MDIYRYILLRKLQRQPLTVFTNNVLPFCIAFVVCYGTPPRIGILYRERFFFSLRSEGNMVKLYLAQEVIPIGLLRWNLDSSSGLIPSTIKIYFRPCTYIRMYYYIYFNHVLYLRHRENNDTSTLSSDIRQHYRVTTHKNDLSIVPTQAWLYSCAVSFGDLYKYSLI